MSQYKFDGLYKILPGGGGSFVPPTPPEGGIWLLEDGGDFLLEDGSGEWGLEAGTTNSKDAKKCQMKSKKE